MVFNVIIWIFLFILIVLAIDMSFLNDTLTGLILSRFIKIGQEYYMPKNDRFSPEFDEEKDYYYAVPRKIVRGNGKKGVYVIMDINDAASNSVNRADVPGASYYEASPSRITVKANAFVASFKRLKNK